MLELIRMALEGDNMELLSMENCELSDSDLERAWTSNDNILNSLGIESALDRNVFSKLMNSFKRLFISKSLKNKNSLELLNRLSTNGIKNKLTKAPFDKASIEYLFKLIEAYKHVDVKSEDIKKIDKDTQTLILKLRDTGLLSNASKNLFITGMKQFVGGMLAAKAGGSTGIIVGSAFMQSAGIWLYFGLILFMVFLVTRKNVKNEITNEEMTRIHDAFTSIVIRPASEILGMNVKNEADGLPSIKTLNDIENELKRIPFKISKELFDKETVLDYNTKVEIIQYSKNAFKKNIRTADNVTLGSDGFDIIKYVIKNSNIDVETDSTQVFAKYSKIIDICTALSDILPRTYDALEIFIKYADKF